MKTDFIWSEENWKEVNKQTHMSSVIRQKGESQIGYYKKACQICVRIRG